MSTVTCADDALLRNVTARGNFQSSMQKFITTNRGTVAFMGGSITEMNGYRPMVETFLKAKFPEVEFTFIPAGISSTCSTTGAFRLQSDVFRAASAAGEKAEPVDLFFIEFAVNDDQDAGHTQQAALQGMEGLIRQALLHNPNMDIVLTYFVNPSMLETLQAGSVPVSIQAHHAVAEHYGITEIHLAQEVADRIAEKTLTWEIYGGVHPAPAGNRIPAEMIAALLEKSWKGLADPKTRPLPPLLSSRSYVRGRFLPSDAVTIQEGWEWQTPDWEHLAGQCRARFKDETLLCADTSGATCTVEFTGTALGAYVLAGPDAGTLQVTIDQREPVEVNLYHHYSKGLHYPRTVMFDDNLPEGAHIARITLLPVKVAEAETTRPRSAARILHLVAN